MSWFLAIGGIILLVVLHEAGHFLAAKAVGMRVEKFFLFFPPKVVSFKRGETEYGVGAIPLGGFVKITGMNPEEELDPEIAPRAYYRQPVWKRIFVIAAGPAVNIAIAFFVLFGLGFGIQERTVEVGEFRSGFEAAQKLEIGDEIVAVDGENVAGLSDIDRSSRIAELIATHECAGKQVDGCAAADPARLEVLRGDRTINVQVRPEFDASVPGLETGQEGRMLLGFSYATRNANLSIAESAEFSVDRMWFVVSETGKRFARILDAEERKQINGIVGATDATRQAFDFDLRTAIGLIGIISLSLGVINLAPFLPLDGGHIFWSVVEKVRGKPVSLHIMERSGVIGFVLVLAIFLIGFTNDINRLTGEGFDIRNPNP